LGSHYSPVVIAFVVEHLRSYDDLILLEALVSSSDRWWDASSAAETLLIGEARARSTLDHLAAHNLLEIRVTADIRYQFHPGTPALHQAALACVDAYRADPGGLARLLVNRGGGLGQRSIRDFAATMRASTDDEPESQG
jgi:hypothetical protein